MRIEDRIGATNHTKKLTGNSEIATRNCGHDQGRPAARPVSSGTPGSVTSVMCHPSALAGPSHVSSDFFGSSLMPSFSRRRILIALAVVIPQLQNRGHLPVVSVFEKRICAIVTEI